MILLQNTTNVLDEKITNESSNISNYIDIKSVDTYSSIVSYINNLDLEVNIDEMVINNINNNRENVGNIIINLNINAINLSIRYGYNR